MEGVFFAESVLCAIIFVCLLITLFVKKIVLKKDIRKTKKVCICMFIAAIVFMIASFATIEINENETVPNQDKSNGTTANVIEDTTKETGNDTNSNERELKHGEVFEAGCYTVVDNVKIMYDGENFVIENNSEKIVRVSCSVYGAKKDGTYQFLGVPSFCGVDEEQYKKDKEENNWAVPEYTNMVRPGGSLTAEIGIVYLSKISEMDVDGDGYYDINFTVSRQDSETSVTISTADKESDYFRLKVK